MNYVILILAMLCCRYLIDIWMKLEALALRSSPKSNYQLKTSWNKAIIYFPGYIRIIASEFCKIVHLVIYDRKDPRLQFWDHMWSDVTCWVYRTFWNHHSKSICPSKLTVIKKSPPVHLAFSCHVSPTSDLCPQTFDLSSHEDFSGPEPPPHQPLVASLSSGRRSSSTAAHSEADTLPPLTPLAHLKASPSSNPNTSPPGRRLPVRRLSAVAVGSTASGLRCLPLVTGRRATLTTANAPLLAGHEPEAQAAQAQVLLARIRRGHSLDHSYSPIPLFVATTRNLPTVRRTSINQLPTWWHLPLAMECTLNPDCPPILEMRCSAVRTLLFLIPPRDTEIILLWFNFEMCRCCCDSLKLNLSVEDENQWTFESLGVDSYEAVRIDCHWMKIFCTWKRNKSFHSRSCLRLATYVNVPYKLCL